MVQRLKAALNGDRERSEHPTVPLTPNELAIAAKAAVAAGAEAVHLHPRDDDGAESLLAGDIGAAVGAVRQACPGVPVGVSTGLWMAGGDPAQRLRWVRSWSILDEVRRPDFASVNLSEAGAGELATALSDFGIGSEAGIWTPADVEALHRLGDGVGWIRILVEIGDAPGRRTTGGSASQVVQQADQILIALAETGNRAPVLLHGENASCWPLVRHAGRLGLATRIGLEDTLVGPGPDRAPADDNAALVQLALLEWQLGAAEG